MAAGIPAVYLDDGSAVLDTQLPYTVDDSRPIRVQQAFRHAGTRQSLDVQGLQGDGLVLVRHLGCQLVRHVPALVPYPTVGLGLQESCLRMIVRTFLFPCQLFVEFAQSAHLAFQGVWVGYLLARAVRIDDAHERVKPHVDAARLMQRLGGVGLVLHLHGEARFVGAVRMPHDGDGVRRGRQFARPTEFDPPYFREREERPLASVRMLDLESRGLGELGGLLPVPAALVPGQSRAMLLPGAAVGHDMGPASLVEAEEVPVGHVRVAYRLLQRCG